MNEPARLAETTTDRRRRRPAISCSLCRRRKIRCNRETPCSNCLKSKSSTCVYETQPDAHGHLQQLSPRRAPPVSIHAAASGQSHDAQAPQHPTPDNGDATGSQRRPGGEQGFSSLPQSNDCSISAPSPASQNSAWSVASLNKKIRDLEQRLSDMSSTSPNHHQHVSKSTLPSETISNEIFGEIYPVNRSVMSKTRLFGQTHWMNEITLLVEMRDLLDRLAQEENATPFALLQRCKALGRKIKAFRNPKSPFQPENSIPQREVADKLVDGYFRTSEKIFRVFHIPTFRMKYEMFWSSPETADPIFLLQLKLTMAVGAATYDDTFSLRVSAVRWIHEAETWLSAPSSKSRLNLPALQIMILLCLSREIVGVGGDLIWISAGAMLRSAMYMGLHRDPSQLPKMTQFVAEMRRRLWNTVLEIALQSSVDSGGPPMISLGDFDTEPPGNYDDNHLVEASDSNPHAESLECYTQMSLPIILRETFPVRLAIAKFLNDLRSQSSYADTLQLDGELRTAYKRLSRTLQAYPATGTSPDQFELSFLDFIIRRYLLVLHAPFVSAALHDASYAFSRRVAVETSLKLFRAACPLTSTPTLHSAHEPSTRSDLSRLSLCAAGLFRSTPIRACLILIVELRAQVLEEESLGPVDPRPDLLAVIYDAKHWYLKRIEAGETNTKGYLMISAMPQYIEGMVQGKSNDELYQIVRMGVEEAAKTCLGILESMVEQNRSADRDECATIPDLDVVSENIDGWDIYDTMPDVQFNFDNVRPFFGSSWILDDTPSDLSTL